MEKGPSETAENPQERKRTAAAPYRESGLSDYERSKRKPYTEWDSRFPDMSVKEIFELTTREGDQMSFSTLSKDRIEIYITSGPRRAIVARHDQEFPENIRDQVGEIVDKLASIEEKRRVWENKVAEEIHDMEDIGKAKSGFAKMLSFIQDKKREEMLRNLLRESWEHRRITEADIEKQLRDIVKAGLLEDAHDEIEAGLKEVNKKIDEYVVKRGELDERYVTLTGA